MKDWKDLFRCFEKYEVSAGYGGVEMIYPISRLFFQDDKHIAKDLNKTFEDGSRLFKWNQDFILKVAKYERDKIDSLAYLLREDEYCKKNNYNGMGLWNFLYELYDCCKKAKDYNLNLYMVEENGEYVLEK